MVGNLRIKWQRTTNTNYIIHSYNGVTDNTRCLYENRPSTDQRTITSTSLSNCKIFFKAWYLLLILHGIVVLLYRVNKEGNWQYSSLIDCFNHQNRYNRFWKNSMERKLPNCYGKYGWIEMKTVKFTKWKWIIAIKQRRFVLLRIIISLI